MLSQIPLHLFNLNYIVKQWYIQAVFAISDCCILHLTNPQSFTEQILFDLIQAYED